MTELPPIHINSETFLRQHCTLPALPSLISRIQEVLCGDNVDIQQVIELISRDPSLVAQIFKVVNSGYYGLPREITRIQFATAFLGLNEVYRMVLSLSVINTLSIVDKAEFDRFWYHSYYAALCTKQMARRYERHMSFEELWSAAILHDIGKLVYLKFFPEHFRHLRRMCSGEGLLFSQAEAQCGLPASAWLGSLLCDHWRLPAQIKQACQTHTLDDLGRITIQTPTEAFGRMICLGNLLAILATDELNEQNKRAIADAITAALGCNESVFLTIMGEVYDLRFTVEQFMKVAN
jgi:HD-like signal output (HDOD) protein